MILDDLRELLARPDTATDPAHPFQGCLPQRTLARFKSRVGDPECFLKQLTPFHCTRSKSAFDRIPMRPTASFGTAFAIVAGSLSALDLSAKLLNRSARATPSTSALVTRR